MKAPKVVFVCQECGAQAPKWMGRCTECGEWNTLQEEAVLDSGIQGGSTGNGRVLTPASVSSMVASDQKRMMSDIPDVDTVLGGGIVAGSVNLIAGQPGIGKSTLLLQLSNAIARGVRQMVDDLKLKLVILWSQTGGPARIFSKNRFPYMLTRIQIDGGQCSPGRRDRRKAIFGDELIIS